MFRRVIPVGLLMLAAIVSTAQTSKTKRQGFVTSISGPQEFLLDSRSVHCGEQSRLVIPEQDGEHLKEMTAEDLVPGQFVKVVGHLAGADYVADRIRIVEPKTHVDKLSGDAMTLRDATLTAASTPGNWTGIVQADGRLLHFTDATRIAGVELLRDGVLPAGTWIKYDAQRTPAGQINVANAAFRPDTVLRDESVQVANLDKRFTPPNYAAHTPGEYKYMGMHFRVEPDEASVKRMQSIGDKLMATVTIPTKPDIHYYVSHGNVVIGGLPFSSGNDIFMTDKVLKDFGPDDSLLAGLLALHIASLLEKEDARAEPRRSKERKLAWATVALVAIPGVTGLAGALSGEFIEGAAELPPELAIFAQDCRVGMRLLSDAGYAPVNLPLALRRVDDPDDKRSYDSGPPPTYSIAMREFRQNYSTVPKLVVPGKAAAEQAIPIK